VICCSLPFVVRCTVMPSYLNSSLLARRSKGKTAKAEKVPAPSG
jgi:hypothetical protein